ncbi:hypothetical protein ASF27_01090 [Methylobacterium sp. Leaf102]|jgi:general secretion pathway protein I|uniref:type II secretion system protein n=1 Tax=unclassified Methylobacterium TaxID=2615210 RepID=UPI0006F5B643|nr:MULTISPECIES: prepilin-type N-terminal cleavage/methylation domain-containing protein [unclassified Methylobacterium]KQO62049.1 hypothetical protein ASF22_06230 [Methylobacterium sp. Leaf87]KQP34195.1 hypothetical protein ASF27_01090 [Methylobacterium sp. Leaf102]KQP36588.1 hypothetical protein ASF25_01080 [Methylobacterium sp. Leaf100]KQP62090.1 hypothetical protein ASF52_05345 [Methylobacterium sp. Leaf112]
MTTGTPRPGDRPEADADAAGFTIVEVLVAFAVTALATLVALETGAGLVAGLRRVDAVRVAVDEAEGVVLRRLSQGRLAPGLTQGAFSNGAPWTLAVSDARPALGLVRAPPLWRIRVTRGGPDGEPVFATVVTGDPDG